MSEFAHELRVKKVVKGSFFFEELLVIEEVKGREDPLEATASLAFVFSLLESNALLLRHVLGCLWWRHVV